MRFLFSFLVFYETSSVLKKAQNTRFRLGVAAVISSVYVERGNSQEVRRPKLFRYGDVNPLVHHIKRDPRKNITLKGRFTRPGEGGYNPSNSPQFAKSLINTNHTFSQVSLRSPATLRMINLWDTQVSEF